MIFYISFLLIIVACRDNSVPVEATSGQALISYARGFKLFEFDKNFVVVIGGNRYSFSKNITGSSYVLSGVTQLQFLKALHEDSSVVGLFDAKYFGDSAVSSRLEKGEILNFKQGNSPDWELLIKHKNSMVLGYSSFNMDEQMIKNLNLTVLPINEFQENHPLGKAEWIKVFGVISGKFALADSIFRKIEERYLAAKPSENDSSHKPRVIAGEYYDGVWTVPGSNSYIAALVADAGGEYVIKNENKSVIMMNKETFSSYLKNAEYWRRVSREDVDVSKLTKEEVTSKYQVHPDRLKALIYCDIRKVNYFDAVLLCPEKELQDFVSAFRNKDTMNFYRLIKVE
ncbi:MAG: ABC transporter substrate-binding protein [Flavobacteriales bacterium]